MNSKSFNSSLRKAANTITPTKGPHDVDNPSSCSRPTEAPNYNTSGKQDTNEPKTNKPTTTPEAISTEPQMNKFDILVQLPGEVIPIVKQGFQGTFGTGSSFYQFYSHQHSYSAFALLHSKPIQELLDDDKRESIKWFSVDQWIQVIYRAIENN